MLVQEKGGDTEPTILHPFISKHIFACDYSSEHEINCIILQPKSHIKRSMIARIRKSLCFAVLCAPDHIRSHNYGFCSWHFFFVIAAVAVALLRLMAAVF